VIIGHEFFAAKSLRSHPNGRAISTGVIVFSIQPALNDPANVYAAPDTRFPISEALRTHIVIPDIVMSRGLSAAFRGRRVFSHGSLAEPMSCIIGGFHVNYPHGTGVLCTIKWGIVPGGAMALLAGAGPMGLVR
jgi:hypothetical protein